jgi:hypothetical protein
MHLSEDRCRCKLCTHHESPLVHFSVEAHNSFDHARQHRFSPVTEKQEKKKKRSQQQGHAISGLSQGRQFRGLVMG